jgi:hypothetical protein
MGPDEAGKGAGSEIFGSAGCAFSGGGNLRVEMLARAGTGSSGILIGTDSDVAVSRTIFRIASLLRSNERGEIAGVSIGRCCAQAGETSNTATKHNTRGVMASA